MARRPIKSAALSLACPRCAGCLFVEILPADSSERAAVFLFACLNCGARLDQIILLNQSIQADGLLPDPHGRCWKKA